MELIAADLLIAVLQASIILHFKSLRRKDSTLVCGMSRVMAFVYVECTS